MEGFHKGSVAGKRDLRIDEDVLGLQIAVDDAPPVKLSKSQHNFARIQSVSIGIEGCVMLQQIKELAAREIIHDEIQSTLCANHVRMRCIPSRSKRKAQSIDYTIIAKAQHLALKGVVHIHNVRMADA
jgi:hypothetical protein